VRLLASGPARLTQALGIGKEHNGFSLLKGSSTFIYEDDETSAYRAREIAQTVRIGLAEGKGDDIPWRFVVPGHPHASRRK
jgi:DNA-3-methyladenine glycosylase